MHSLATEALLASGADCSIKVFTHLHQAALKVPIPISNDYFNTIRIFNHNFITFCFSNSQARKLYFIFLKCNLLTIVMFLL
ncbi:hypothetical protein LguiA_035001 [Lonicera macranthoides]